MDKIRSGKLEPREMKNKMISTRNTLEQEVVSIRDKKTSYIDHTPLQTIKEI